MARNILNFGAGPAMLPEAVLLQAQQELLDWGGRGISVMEISHRSDEFMVIVEQSELTLRKLLSIPDNYHILFLSGGATHQFSVIPMNLVQGKNSVDYIHTGVWSGKAIQEAKSYTKINEVCSGKKTNFTSIPKKCDWRLNPDAAYCYYTANETISGLEFPFTPEVEVPLVSDMTSSFLSRLVPVDKFGLIFAGGQKNICPAGLTIVIVKDSLLGKALPYTPNLLNYSIQAKEKSLLNTPPTFNWYMANLMFSWVLENGGVEIMQKQSECKAAILYKTIDNSNLYNNNIDKDCRSIINVTFTLKNDSLNKLFLLEAEKEDLYYLRGHRLAGGMRASLYNGMPESGVVFLSEFMQEFERKHY